MELREPKTSPGGRKADRGRAVGQRSWVLFSLLVAFVEAGLVVVFFGGSLSGKPDTTGTTAVTLPSVAAGLAQPETTVPAFDAEALRARIEEIAQGHEGVYGVAVLDPVSGTRVSLRDDETFLAASIGKLPTFATLYKAAARGELDLDEKIPILPEGTQPYGTGDSQNLLVGYSPNLRELAYSLIHYSDNDAWVTLDRRIGEEKIRTELEGMGIENPQYYGYLYGYYATPADVLLLLENISDPRFTSEGLSAEMLDAMTETSLEDRIPDKLPPDVRVAHKTGSYDRDFGDAGIVFYKDAQGAEKRYYLVVLAGDTAEYEARDAIQNISLAVYEALTGTRGDPGFSRGASADRAVSGADIPSASQPSPAQNTKAPKESTEPAKLPLDGKSSPENRYNGPAGDSARQPESTKPAKLPSDKKPSQQNWDNVVPDAPFAPPYNPYPWGRVDPKAPTYEENTYWDGGTES